MKKAKWLIGLSAVMLLASCGGDTPSAVPGKTVDQVIAGFKTSVTGTVTLTYDAKYKVDVISEKGGMENFKHDVDDKTVAELDLTQGNLYAHIKRDGKDGATSTTSEALVYKVGETYNFVTTTMAEPVALEDEGDALEKINYLLKKTSYNLAGYVDLETLLYNNTDYMWKQFGLETSNIAAEDFVEPTNTVNNVNGLHAVGELDYIGYKTDGGISDFPGREEAPASVVTIDTTADGYVTSYSQTLAASLAMAIMNPAPMVTIDGNKTFAATYGEAVTKLTTIEHHLTKGTVEYPNSNKGIVEVFTGKAATKESCVTPVADKGEVIVGEYLGIIVTPAGANTIKNLSNNDVTVVDPKAGQMYFFEVQEGANKIGVNYVGNDVNPDAKYGTLNLIAPEGVEATVTSFILDGGAKDRQPVGADNKVDLGRWASFVFTKLPEGKVIDTVIGEDSKGVVKGLFEFPGEGGVTEYCILMAKEQVYDVTVTLKDEAPAVTKYGTVVFHAPEGVTPILKQMAFGPQGPVFTDPVDGNKVEVGKLASIMVPGVEEAKLSVTDLNGKSLKAEKGYGFQVKDEIEYHVVIKVEGKETVVAGYNSVTVNAPEGIEWKGQALDLSQGFPPKVVVDFVSGSYVKTSWFIKVTVTTPAADGKAYKVATAEGVDLQFRDGGYSMPLAADVVINITVVDAPAA